MVEACIAFCVRKIAIMSSTAACIEAILETYPDTQASHWKRRHKQESAHSEVARVFENTKNSSFCTVYSYDGMNVVKDGDLMPKTDPKVMKALVKAANSIVHCGDGMAFYWNPTSMTAWMAMADSDCPPEIEGHESDLTTGEEVIRRMMAAGAKRVLLVAESHPYWGDEPACDEDEDLKEDDDEMNEASWWMYFCVNGVTGIEAPSKW